MPLHFLASLGRFGRGCLLLAWRLHDLVVSVDGKKNGEAKLTFDGSAGVRVGGVCGWGGGVGGDASVAGDLAPLEGGL